MCKILEASTGCRNPQIVVSFALSDYGEQQTLSQIIRSWSQHSKPVPSEHMAERSDTHPQFWYLLRI